MASRPSIVEILAFFQRIIDRRGIPSIEPYGKNLDERALRYFALLSLPIDSLRFNIAMRNLSRQYDLFSEDAVFSASVLQLQVRVFQLGGRNLNAHAVTVEQLSRAPMSKLFSAVVLQASADGFRNAQFDFHIDDCSPIRIFYKREGSLPVEAMTIPKNLALPLKGHAFRVDRAGFANVRQYMHEGDRLPEDVSFDWSVSNSLTLTW